MFHGVLVIGAWRRVRVDRIRHTIAKHGPDAGLVVRQLPVLPLSEIGPVVLVAELQIMTPGEAAQIEIEHAHELIGHSGKLRLLAFHNHSKMTRFDDALDLGTQTSATPDINLVRNGDKSKYGLGLNLEQAINENVGIFMRARWADGRTETYAFTEIDHSLSAGTLIKGSAWHRPEDTMGLAFAINGLSKSHRNYLAAGGQGFFLGDGNLNYQTENIAEVFYNLKLTKFAWLSADYQHINNPGYNADRGPVNFSGFRLHTEF